MEHYEIAVNAARAAGVVHQKYFGTDLQIREKGSSFDRVTVADLEAEQSVVSVIKEKFPEHNILAEEGTYEKTDSSYTWIIDPLDGTNNFSFGLPIFCVSIALAHRGEILLGVIYDVTRDELFTARKGHGAQLNGAPIHVSGAAALNQSILITGFYYDRGQDMDQTLETMRKFFQVPVVGIRRLGAAALDLCYVAAGRASGFWEFCLSPWDFAAGKLLIEEAGGKVTTPAGHEVKLERSFVVASNSKIHEAMLDIVKRRES